ncbi:NUDIX domain-containing protein [Streptomyces sp. NPDC005322]
MRIPGQAAGVAVLDPSGPVFLFRYDNEEVGVHWAMPGGGLDPDETPLQAAEREVREETGVDGHRARRHGAVSVGARLHQGRCPRAAARAHLPCPWPPSRPGRRPRRRTCHGLDSPLAMVVAG